MTNYKQMITRDKAIEYFNYLYSMYTTSADAVTQVAIRFHISRSTAVKYMKQSDYNRQ